MKKMYSRLLLFACVLIVSVAACQIFSDDAEPEATLLVPDVVGTKDVEATETTVAGDDATEQPVLTLDRPTSTPVYAYLTAQTNMNVRSGPGVDYMVVGWLSEGKSAEIIGRAPDVDWWKIVCLSAVSGDECWVSGGAQYTDSANIGSVPLVAVPTLIPAPTEIPSQPVIEAVLAYIENGAVWTVNVSVDGGVVSAETPLQHTPDVGAISLKLSPDGQKVAFKRELIGNNNELMVVQLPDDTMDSIVHSGMLSQLTVEGFDPETTRRIVHDYEWAADSSRIVFNTRMIMEGPGYPIVEDLWLGETGMAPVELFSPGEGGGVFAVNSSDQVIMALSDSIALANLDGSGRQEALAFPNIYTYSEYVYYPVPMWTKDGSAAFVAVPNQEQLAPGAMVELWRISADGTGTQLLGGVDGNFLFGSANWSANGTQLAVINAQPDTLSSPEYQLLVGDGEALNLSPFNSGPNSIRFLGWNSAETVFLYEQAGNPTTPEASIVIGAVVSGNSQSIPLSSPMGVATVCWLTDDIFLVSIHEADGGGPIYMGDLTGALSVIMVGEFDTNFDLWIIEAGE